MPTRVVVDDDEQQIADLEKAFRRLRARLATTSVRGSHDEFTAAATPASTYDLTYIPVDGTCLMALNGLVQEEGVDYSVNYDTGIVTVAATQASGDHLTFRYLVTDWLVARSLPEEGDDPTEPTGLAFWWKADALALSNGDPVGSWVDSSGNSLTLVQATAGNKPTWHSAPTGFGGKPAVLFDGVDDQLSLPYTATVNPAAMTIIAVIQPATLGTNLIIAQSETGSTGYALKVNSTPSGLVHVYFHGSSGLVGTNCGSIVSANTTHWVTGTTTGSGTTALGYMDGASGGGANTGDLTPNTTDALNIGVFDGYIAEIIGYDRVLTDPERGLVDTYIQAKYGL